MAITSTNCPKCDSIVYASIGSPSEIVKVECPRCHSEVSVKADERALEDLTEAETAAANYSRNRFAELCEAHSHEVEEVIDGVKAKYQEELKIINAESDIPTLEHVNEDIEEALAYITEDTKAAANEASRTAERIERGKKTVKERVKDVATNKVISTIANRYLDGNAEQAGTIYELITRVLSQYRSEELTRNNVMETAMNMQLSEEEIQAIYNLIDNGTFGSILKFIGR